MIATRRSSRPSRLLAVVCAVALAFGLAACGSDSDSAGGGGGGGGDLPPGDFVLVADNIAWDTDTIAAPADEEFVIVIDNQDDGVQHNLHIKDTDFKTPLESGVSAQVLPVTLAAGEYDYVCDLHPNMIGTITAS